MEAMKYNTAKNIAGLRKDDRPNEQQHDQCVSCSSIDTSQHVGDGGKK
jgi:hypothetical protein